MIKKLKVEDCGQPPERERCRLCHRLSDCERGLKHLRQSSHLCFGGICADVVFGESGGIDYEIVFADPYALSATLHGEKKLTGLIEMLTQLRDESLPEVNDGHDWWVEFLKEEAEENRVLVALEQNKKQAKLDLLFKMQKERAGREA